MGKHAYLIMAHTKFEQVIRLLKLIDNPLNDIYLHIDKKVKNTDALYKKFRSVIKQSNIYFVKQHKVSWGGYSQIETEMELLKEAVQNNYEYYHLLSGADLPLKKQEEIHAFFDKNKGKEFVQFGNKEYIKNIKSRFQFFWIGQEYLGNQKNICSKIRYVTVLLQKIMKIDRTKKIQYAAGANWFSITNDFAKYVVSNSQLVEKLFKHTICCDEVFLQTLLINSPYKNSIYHKEFDGDYHAIMRKIDWERGNPYVWCIDD